MQKRRYSIRAHEKSAKCSVGVGLQGFKSFLILLAAPQCTQEATASSRGDAQTYKDNIISKRWANLGIKLKELKSRFLCRGYIIFWQKIQKQKYHVCVPINFFCTDATEPSLCSNMSWQTMQTKKNPACW